MMPVAGKKGFGLGIFVVMLTLLVALIICQNYFFMTTDNIIIASRTCDTIRAYYIADAGLAAALVQLRAGGIHMADPIGDMGNPINYPVDGTHNGLTM